jgi:hypothetical protein
MFRQAATEILQLAADVRQYRATAELFRDVDRLVDSLPLTTHEYALAKRRLCNSRNYYRQRQLGAALYELRLLAGRLRYYR